MKTKTKLKVKEFFARLLKTLKRPDMALLPGQVAFFLVLAIIPTITLVTYGASVLNLSIDFLYDFLQKAFSSEIADLLLKGSSVPNAGLNLTVVILFCYYLASNGADSIILASNTIYGIKNGNWFQRRLKAIVLTIILVVLIVFLLIFPIFGDQIINLIAVVNLNHEVTAVLVKIFGYLQSPIMWILLFFLIKIIYMMAPDRSVKGQNANYGAIFTTIAWIVSTYLYTFYINNIANFSAFYGNLTSICVLMIWFYLISCFFVIGMNLNFQREADNMEKITRVEED